MIIKLNNFRSFEDINDNYLISGTKLYVVRFDDMKELRYYEGAAKDKTGLRYVLESDKTYMLQDKSGDLVFYTERYILDKVFEDIFKNLLGI